MRIRVASVELSSAVALCALLPVACGDGGRERTKAAATTAAVPASPATVKVPFVPLDACSLLTKAEVEALVGTRALEPRREQTANLVTCAFGDPESPKVAGRSLAQVLSLSVFTGEEGAYHAGPVAQARDAYETTRKNAASAEAVAGLGDDAYWDGAFKSLSARKGRYWITVEAASGRGAAEKAMGKAIARLP